MIAPSGVMDGTVHSIRQALDFAGRGDVAVMSYAAKFASLLYGPFKAATSSEPGKSKHATHQLDVANSGQALARIASDIDEGADIVIVKPALGYLDVVARARERFQVPIAAYSVSGEYNMALALADGDLCHRRELMMEMLTCIKRSGADMIITYAAPEIAAHLKR